MDVIKYYTFLPDTVDYHEFLAYLEETDDLICEGKLSLRNEASDGERRKAFRDGEHAVKKRRIIGGEILLLVERSAMPYEDAVKGEWKMSAGKFRDRIHEDFSFL